MRTSHLRSKRLLAVALAAIVAGPMTANAANPIMTNATATTVPPPSATGVLTITGANLLDTYRARLFSADGRSGLRQDR